METQINQIMDCNTNEGIIYHRTVVTTRRAMVFIKGKEWHIEIPGEMEDDEVMLNLQNQFMR